MDEENKLRFETLRGEILADKMISAEDQHWLLDHCIAKAQGTRPTEKKPTRQTPQKVTLQSLLN